MKKIILAVVMFFSISAVTSAQNNFSLNSMAASQPENMEEISPESMDGIGLEGVLLPSPAYAFIPGSKAPLITPALDLSIKLPFDMINERIAEVKEVTIINPAQPILKRSGDHLVLGNISININGMEVEPTVSIKPWFEGNNKLAIKFM